MHIEYTTDRPQGQAPRYELDSTGRLTHRYTADELPLHDVSPSGRVRPWRTHKQEGLALSDIYETLGTDPDFENAAKALDKARRLSACAQWAEFEQLPEGQGLRLHDASFCRVRLCPMCQWRRSLKLGAQVRRVVERANADHIRESGTAWRWLMITFTVKTYQAHSWGAKSTDFTRRSTT